MVLAYIAGTKQKEAGGAGNEIYSFTHMQKVHDAILFRARTARQVLSTTYYAEMDSFLNSFKKETANARSKGNMDGKSADPISFSLY